MRSRPEVEWDEVEQGWMDALRWWRDEYLCPCGCGFPVEVAQDPMTEFRVQVPNPTRCHVRTALIRAREGDRESKRQQPDALLYAAQVRLDPGADDEHG